MQDKSGSLSLQEPQDFVILPVIEKWHLTLQLFFTSLLKSDEADWIPSRFVAMAFHDATLFGSRQRTFTLAERLLPLCWQGRLQFWAIDFSDSFLTELQTAGPNAWDLSRLWWKGGWVCDHSAWHHKYWSKRSMFEIFVLLGWISLLGRRLFEQLSASNLRPVYPGTSW